ncbi:IMPACT family protein [Pseudomonas nitroreducens]|uniref:IMPACT family protein n=1 Tax=Pseudomonas nitroreducens TaxID=46680 RepID=UPI0020A05D86|nr:YigZ family protein [Pseudomonas nitroreducens]MCP1621695.1 putative YigZ family protein [Pseudomonas nitroreducens]
MSFTLAGPAVYQEDIRKSRFHCVAAPIASEAEAHAFLAAHRDPGAGHNCWAWKLGNQYRFSDDGEPGGTAGRPMLVAIEGQDMDRVVVVVSRWFGGIKLGTGGLARAYGGCAAKCLQDAERIELVPSSRLAFDCSFAEHALLKARVLALGASIEDEAFAAEGVHMTLNLPTTLVEPLQKLLGDLSRGRIQAQLLDA